MYNDKCLESGPFYSPIPIFMYGQKPGLSFDSGAKSSAQSFVLSWEILFHAENPASTVLGLM